MCQDERSGYQCKQRLKVGPRRTTQRPPSPALLAAANGFSYAVYWAIDLEPRCRRIPLGNLSKFLGNIPLGNCVGAQLARQMTFHRVGAGGIGDTPVWTGR
jgi:hypothetical protein